MSKVAIVSARRSYLLTLAIELNKKEDIEVTLYTILPSSRCRSLGYTGRIVSGFFPFAFLEKIVDLLPFINSYRKSKLRVWLRIIYDYFVSWKLKKCDFLIGGNGSTVEASKVAKRKYAAITICDQGSSHILAQNAARELYTDSRPPLLNTDYMLRHYEVVDFLMAPCQYVITTDLDHGIDKAALLYNPLGVNLSIFRPTVKPVSDSYDVIMVGSWWKHKGCDLLAEACLEKLGYSLLHVGSVVDCPLPNNPLFKHIDFVPEFELPVYYAQAKVFAMPSLDEGFGLVLSQAVACGLPIVGSSRTGAPDLANLLGNPEGCITINEPLSTDNIALAIKQALAYANSLPDGPRVQYQKEIHKLSWESYGNRYYGILKELTIR